MPDYETIARTVMGVGFLLFAIGFSLETLRTKQDSGPLIAFIMTTMGLFTLFFTYN